jgi:hypothetical protein
VAEDSGSSAADGGGVGFFGECRVEGAEGAFAAFVAFEGVDGGDPGLDGRVAEFADDVEEVLVEVRGEFVHVLISVQERGDEAARVGREGGQVGQVV